MTTRISYDTAPAEVRALVATYRYVKHRVDASIELLYKHKALVRKDTTVEGLDYQQTHNLICLLEDFQDRMQRLERVTFPAPKKSASTTPREPSSVPVVETLL
jgi:hypothetical protein